jgi:hypothetical protein
VSGAGGEGSRTAGSRLALVCDVTPIIVNQELLTFNQRQRLATAGR